MGHNVYMYFNHTDRGKYYNQYIFYQSDESGGGKL